MKTQIIRRIFLAVIIVLVAFSNNNGSTMRPSIKITCIHVQTNETNIKSSITANGDFKNTTCHVCIHINQDETPEIPEPNGDHEIHSFNFDHDNKRTFWKNIANKIFSAVYYLVVLICCIPYKF